MGSYQDNSIKSTTSNIRVKINIKGNNNGGIMEVHQHAIVIKQNKASNSLSLYLLV